MVYKQIALELSLSHEHGAHAPPQHLRQARRGRPRPGRAARHRARLALARALAEEKELQFGSFTNDDAWALGCALVEAARGLPVAIDISRGEQRLFHAGLPGSAADNDAWIERKNRVVRRFGHSSYYMNVSSEGEFNARYLLDESEFAAHGGAFPVIVRGVGVVGTVTVSGLPQEEDHRFVVGVLRAFLGG